MRNIDKIVEIRYKLMQTNVNHAKCSVLKNCIGRETVHCPNSHSKAEDDELEKDVT